ncbi:MAG TPA: response regulator [Deferrisomatales bacterium]|nr:response regulator [Deferrisomatales bacterium]
MEQKNAFLQALIQALPDIVYFKDPKRRYQLANPAFADIAAVDLTEVTGKTDAEVLHPDLVESSQETDGDVLNMGTSLRFEQKTADDKGRQLYFETRKAPVRDGRGGLLGLVAVSRNITAIKRAEADLRVAKETAVAANLAKSEFLANMSHEVRTPLNGILGMIDLVLGHSPPPQQSRYLLAAQRSARSLLRIINEILDFSSIEAGKLEIEEAVFDPRQVAEDAVEDLSVSAHEKGLELVCDILPPVPRSLVGDAGRLRQVLVNILGNAVKFTVAGEVVLRVQAYLPAGSDGGRCLLEASVSDTGIGIPRDKLGVLFESFRQLDGSLTRRHQGTGLGLTISKNIVEMMGGSIHVDSEVGQGSRFTFTLPVKLGDRTSVAEAEDGARGMRVLVVDDSASVLESLQHLLGSLGAETVLVSTGDAALERLEAAERADRRFQMTLLDAGLVGPADTSWARQMGRFSPAMGRLVMMTPSLATGATASRHPWTSADWITKPITRLQLIQCVRAVLNPSEQDLQRPWDGTKPPSGSAESALPAPFAAGPAPPRVLLVEDDAVSRMYMQSLLEQHDLRVTAVSQGNAAIREMESGEFDLVLMDLQMPDMDGLQATRAIRQFETSMNRRTPIIGITAHGLNSDRLRCLEAGMDAHLAKPVDPQKLLAMAGQFLRPRQDPVTETETASNIAKLLGHLGGDKRVLGSIVATFLKTVPRAVADLRAAVKADDAKGVAAAAHAIRGSVGIFGATGLMEISRSIEKMGESGELAGVEAALLAFERELGLVSDSLTRAV